MAERACSGGTRPGRGRVTLPVPIWRLRAARAVLAVERLGVALWRPFCLLAAAAAAALCGLFTALPPALHTILLLGLAAGLVVSLRAGRQALRFPSLPEAERRLERDSGLVHRPFAVLRDHPAGLGPDDPFWRRHRARAAASLATLRLAGPDPRLAVADPCALRAAASLALVAGLVIAGPQAGMRLATLVSPRFAPARAVVPPIIQAWIQPPGYTGLPPVFLPPAGSTPQQGTDQEGSIPGISVPAGSRLTVSLTGLDELPSLTLGGAALKLEPLGNASFQGSATLDHGGRLALATWLSPLATWDISLLPNEAPVIAWAAPPGRAGTSLSTKFPWAVAQRWGVASLAAELRPQGRPDLPSLTVPLPLPGTPRHAEGAATIDLAANPYAGLTLTARLTGRDVSGQAGTSATADVVLPARTFHHPLARAIADLRRRLALHPDRPADSADELAALAEAPLPRQDAAHLAPAAVILNLTAAASVLRDKPVPEAVAAVQGRLWFLALALDGALPDPESAALAEAREKLRQGLEDRAQGKLTQKELQQRLDALREALDKRLQDIARQAMKQGALEKFDPLHQHLSSSTMDRLIRRMEEAARDGRMQDARRALAQLEKLLDQLKTAHVMTKQEQAAQQEAERQGRRMMGAVQDLVKRESGLLDNSLRRGPAELPGQPPQLHSFVFPPPVPGADLPDTPPPLMDGGPPGSDDAPPDARPQGFPEANAPPPPPGFAPIPPAPQTATPAPETAADQSHDAHTQKALRRALDALSDTFAKSGGRKPRNLDDAAHAMDEASHDLAAHLDPQARDAIGRAIAALQKGAQNMAQQMQGKSGGQMQLSLQPGGRAGDQGGTEGEETGDGSKGGRKDPFGRQVDGNGQVADDPSLRVPDEMEQGRSRAIQDELRRRGADRQRPQQELDYIGRLLKPF